MGKTFVNLYVPGNSTETYEVHNGGNTVKTDQKH